MKETGMQFVGNIPLYYHKYLSHKNTHTHKNSASFEGNNRITHTLSLLYNNLAVFLFLKIPPHLHL